MLLMRKHFYTALFSISCWKKYCIKKLFFSSSKMIKNILLTTIHKVKMTILFLDILNNQGKSSYVLLLKLILMKKCYVQNRNEFILLFKNCQHLHTKKYLFIKMMKKYPRGSAMYQLHSYT